MGLSLFIGVIAAALLPVALSGAIEPNIPAGSGTHPPEPQASLILRPEVTCTYNSFNPYDMVVVKAKAVAWGEQWKIGWRDSQHWTHASAAFTLCNCNMEWGYVEEEEINEFLAFLEWRCGVGRTGYVWSSHNGKGYDMDNAEAWRASQKCPQRCLATRNIKALDVLMSE